MSIKTGTGADQIREQYVADLIRTGSVHDPAVERAFRRVRRHRFVEQWFRLEASRLQADWVPVGYDRDHPSLKHLRAIYSNQALVTGVDGFYTTSSTSQPSLVAAMLESLRLRPGHRVLEIGTGTGYNAALLAEVLGNPECVYTVEIQPGIAEQAVGHLVEEGYHGTHVRCGDAAEGWAEGAPYDRIEATVGCSDIMPRWLDQLAPDGLMVVPLEHGHLHTICRIERSRRSPGSAGGRVVDVASFMPMQGSMARPNVWQSYLMEEVPALPRWKQPLPALLPRTDQHPLRHKAHADFYFFLTLCSRELWRTNQGYGLADPGCGSAILIECDGVCGYAGGSSGTGTSRLYDRLQALFEEWETHGCPSVGEYVLEFVPRKQVPELRSGPQWVIERAHHWEIVQL